MEILKKLGGKLFYYLARIVEVFSNGLIWTIENTIEILRKILDTAKRVVLVLFVMATLSIFILIPLMGALISSPIIKMFFVLFITFWLIIFLGELSLPYIEYFKYTFSEYFYDRSDYLLKNKKVSFETLSEYGEDYKRRKREEERKAEELRREAERRRYEEARRQQEAERKRFEENFYRQFEDFFKQQTGNSYRSYQSGYENPNSVFSNSFKSEYEKNCDILEVNYNSTREDIQKAYRRKAKEYHPDLNKSENATEMFQKINDANNFLSEENINRYKNLNN